MFSRDGRYLYGSSYYTGVSNIYRYEIATGEARGGEQRRDRVLPPGAAHGRRARSSSTTPREGFVPAMIEPEPTEDLSAITFLGEQIATQASGRARLECGVPGACRLRVQRAAPGRSTGRTRAQARSVLSDRRGLQGLRGARRARAIQRSARLQHAPASRELQPRRLAAVEGTRLHAAVQLPAVLLGGRAQLERRGLLRPVRADQAQSQGLQRLRGLRPSAHLRAAGDDVPERRRSPTTATSTRCPTSRTSRRRRDKLFTGEVGLDHENARSSIGSVDDETGYTWGTLAHVYGADGDLVPGLVGQFDVGFAAAARPLLDLAAQRGRRLDGRPRRPARELLLRRLRQQLRRRRRGEALSRGAQHARLRDRRDRRPHLRQVDARDGTCRRCASRRSARPASTCRGRAPHCSRRRSRRISRTATFAQTVYNVGVQVDFQLTCMHGLPMMLSFGYARGFADGGRDDDEFMISLKVL